MGMQHALMTHERSSLLLSNRCSPRVLYKVTVPSVVHIHLALHESPFHPLLTVQVPQPGVKGTRNSGGFGLKGSGAGLLRLLVKRGGVTVKSMARKQAVGGHVPYRTT